MNPTPPPHPKSLAARLAKARTIDDDPQLMSVTEAAARLRVGATKMRKLIKEKKVKGIMVGRSLRVVAQSLDEYVEGLMK